MDQPNRQPSPFFINRIDRDLGAIEPEFFRFTEEAEAWTKVHEYLRIVRKRSIFMVAVTLLVIAFAAARDLSTPSLYTATATLLINNNVPSLFVDQGGTVSSQADFSGYDSDDQTEYQLLRSAGVLVLGSFWRKGCSSLPPNQSAAPTFTGEIKRWLKSWLPFSRPAKKATEQLGGSYEFHPAQLMPILVKFRSVLSKILTWSGSAPPPPTRSYQLDWLTRTPSSSSAEELSLTRRRRTTLASFWPESSPS